MKFGLLKKIIVQNIFTGSTVGLTGLAVGSILNKSGWALHDADGLSLNFQGSRCTGRTLGRTAGGARRAERVTGDALANRVYDSLVVSIIAFLLTGIGLIRHFRVLHGIIVAIDHETSLAG